MSGGEAGSILLTCLQLDRVVFGYWGCLHDIKLTSWRLWGRGKYIVAINVDPLFSLNW